MPESSKHMMYTLPQNELQVTIDSSVHGMTKALEDFKTRPDISKEELEQDITKSCKQLEKVPNFTNDHNSYLRIAKQWYTHGYLTMQSLYQKDPEAYKKERRQFEEWGYAACYKFTKQKVIESMMVGGVHHE